MQVTDIFNFRNGNSLEPTGYLPTFIDSLIGKQLLDLEFLYGGKSDTPRELPAPRKTRPSAPAARWSRRCPRRATCPAAGTAW